MTTGDPIGDPRRPTAAPCAGSPSSAPSRAGRRAFYSVGDEPPRAGSPRWAGAACRWPRRPCCRCPGWRSPASKLAGRAHRAEPGRPRRASPPSGCAYRDGAARRSTDQIRAISEEWVADKGLPEMGFTLGGLDELADDAVPLLVAVDADRHRARGDQLAARAPRRRRGRLDAGLHAPPAATAFRGVMEFLIASAALRPAATRAASSCRCRAPRWPGSTAARPGASAAAAAGRGRAGAGTGVRLPVAAGVQGEVPAASTGRCTWPTRTRWRCPRSGCAIGRAYLPRPHRPRGRRGWCAGLPVDRAGSRRRGRSRWRARRTGGRSCGAGSRRRPRRCWVALVVGVPHVVAGSPSWSPPRPAGAAGTPAARTPAGSARSRVPARWTARGAGSRRRSPAVSTVGRSRRAAPQQRPQPGHQHHVGERLGQVVVGAEVEAPRPRRTRRPWRSASGPASSRPRPAASSRPGSRSGRAA